MKKNYTVKNFKTLPLIAFLLLLPLLFSAQYANRILATSGYSIAYEPIQAITTPDKGMLIGGGYGRQYMPGLHRDSSQLLKFDSMGVLQWAKKYQTNSNKVCDQHSSHISSIANSPNGGYYVSLMSSPGPLSSEIQLLKLGLTGNVQWEKYHYLDQDTVTAATEIEVFKNGDILHQILKGIRFTRLDSLGTVVWAKHLSIATPHHFIRAHVTLDDGVGVLAMDVSNPNNGGIIFCKVSSIGNLQWSKTIKFTTPSLIIDPTNFTQTSDSGYVIVGKNSFTSLSNFIPFMLKIDKNGNVLWMKNYSVNTQTGAIFSEISELKNGNLITHGINSNLLFTSGAGSDLIIQTDVSGNVIHSALYYDSIYVKHLRLYSDNKLSIIYSKIPYTQKPYILTKESNDFTQNCNKYVPAFATASNNTTPLSTNTISITGFASYSPYLLSSPVVITFSVLTTPECAVVSSVNDLSRESNFLSVSPNPANDYFELELGKSKETKVRITDQLGRTIDSFSFSKDNKRYSTSHFTNGIYFVYAESLGFKSVKKLIINH